MNGVAARDEIAGVIADNIAHDFHPPSVRGLDHIREICPRAPGRGPRVKVLPAVPMIGGCSAYVEYNRGNPDGGRAKRLDVIELVLDASEIAPVNSVVGHWRIGRSVAGFDVVVRRIAVVVPIREDLVDVLVSPVDR